MHRPLISERFQDLIRNGGLSFTETPSSFLLVCPKCSKKKLAIQKKEGYWCCYKCKSDGFKGRPENIIHILFNIPLEDVRGMIYENFAQLKEQIFLKLNVIDPWEDEISAVDYYDEIPLEEVVANPFFVTSENPLFEPGRRYLIDQRGLTEKHIQKHGLMYNTMTRCVVFPIKHRNKLFGWQERSIKGDIKMTMKGFERDKALMFFDNLTGSKHAIVSEGPVDALKLDILGGSVCTMGKDVSPYQIKLIVNSVDKVYLALDPDASLEKSRICKEIADIKEVYIMSPPKKDFGMCTEEEVLKAFEEAVPYFGQKFIHLIDLYDRN